MAGMVLEIFGATLEPTAASLVTLWGGSTMRRGVSVDAATVYRALSGRNRDRAAMCGERPNEPRNLSAVYRDLPVVMELPLEGRELRPGGNS